MLQYSIDNGNTWNDINWGYDNPVTLQVSSGDTVLLRGEDASLGVFNVMSDLPIDVEGNYMSLLYGDNFYGQTSFPNGYEGGLFAFRRLAGLTSAENLVLPATTLEAYCYQSMFLDCTNLTTAPSILPATTLAEGCYYYMFAGCTSLTTAPELPATTLAESCYASMFQECTNLTTAPSILPATTLADYCYQSMFQGCTSLTTAPELPATTLAESCYASMFQECTNLTTAPELPATTLVYGCYGYMFDYCTSLTTAPELPATTLAEYCYQSMFYGCTSLTTAPELPATTLTPDCYRQMFYNCTSLNYIKCLATDISAVGCTNGWVGGVASAGTFVKNSNMSSWTTGVNGIPNGWTVQDAS